MKLKVLFLLILFFIITPLSSAHAADTNYFSAGSSPSVTANCFNITSENASEIDHYNFFSTINSTCDLSGTTSEDPAYIRFNEANFPLNLRDQYPITSVHVSYLLKNTSGTSPTFTPKIILGDDSSCEVTGDPFTVTHNYNVYNQTLDVSSCNLTGALTNVKRHELAVSSGTAGDVVQVAFMAQSVFYTAPVIQMEVAPVGGTRTRGEPFNVDIVITNDGETPINAARANVSVSPNLDINAIHTPTSNSCNFQFTKQPTTSSPSFAGAVYGGSVTACTIFTMTLTPNNLVGPGLGTGTISFINPSIRAYDDNLEILSSHHGVGYDLIGPTTPTPTTAFNFTVTNPLLTYKTNFNLTGTKQTSITSIFVNGSDDDSEYPTATTWQIPVTLSLGDNPFTLYGSDGTNMTASQAINVNRHILGDINGDGEIDLIDASLFAIDWDKTEGLTYVLSDMNDDGNVDLTDLSILAKLEE